MFTWSSLFRWDVRRWSNRRLALAALPAYWLAAFLLLAAAWRLAGTGARGLGDAPPDAPTVADGTPAHPAGTTAGSRGAADDYSAIWKRNLREAYNPPKPPAPPPPKSRPQLKLVGTIIEPPNNLAVIVGAGGEKRIVGVGESAFGATVKRVGELSATVEVEGEEFELKREQP